ncbi:MAG TPA: tetratricopeptide repeat protein, partial [Solirubrobacteraceae bacterium]
MPTVAETLHERVRLALARLIRRGLEPGVLPQGTEVLLDLPAVSQAVKNPNDPADCAAAVGQALRQAAAKLPRETRAVLDIVLALDPKYSGTRASARRALAGEAFRAGKSVVRADTIRQYHEPRALDQLAAMLVADSERPKISGRSESVAGPSSASASELTPIRAEARSVSARMAGQIVVGELPGSPPAHIAREATERLTELSSGSGQATNVVTLTGVPGTGKTHVAAEYGRRAVAEGVELVAWVSAEDHDRLVSGLAEVARAIGVDDPEGDSERSAERLRAALAVRKQPSVLVLDNAVDPDDVRHYVPTTGATRVIITSTDRAFGTLGEEIDVGSFDRTQSLSYLAERTGLSDDAGADALAQELGDLPLALAQAAAVVRLRRLSYAEYLDRLRAQPLVDVLPPDRGDAYRHGVALAILLAVRAADDADATGLTARILSAAALLSSDGVGVDVLTAVVDVDDAAVEAALGRLVERSLLVWARGQRAVVMHRLVAWAIQDRLQQTRELRSALGAVAEKLDGLFPPESEAWKYRERTDLVGHAISVWVSALAAADRQAITTTDLVGFADVANRAVRHLRATADLSRAIEVGTSLAMSCTRRLGADHPQTLASSNTLAGAYEAAGDLTRAIPLYEDTLTTSERVLGPDHPATLAFRNNLAGAYAAVGDLTRAIALYQDTLTTSERVLGPDHPDTLTSRNNLAYAYQAVGDLNRALPLYQDTLANRERILGPDHPATLGSRNNLANAYEAAGDLTRAIP